MTKFRVWLTGVPYTATPPPKLFTGTAGALARNERAARTERLQLKHFARSSHLAVLIAGDGARGPSEELER